MIIKGKYLILKVLIFRIQSLKINFYNVNVIEYVHLCSLHSHINYKYLNVEVMIKIIPSLSKEIEAKDMKRSFKKASDCFAMLSHFSRV